MASVSKCLSAISVPISDTIWWADDSSCSPTLADLGDILCADLFVETGRWILDATQ